MTLLALFYFPQSARRKPKVSKSTYESDEDDVPLSARKKFKVKRKTPDSEDEDIKPVCDLSMCQFYVLNTVDNYNS